MNYCKNCKHSREDTKMNTTNLSVGLLLLGFPLPPVIDDTLECRNSKSIYYTDDVDEYNSCKYFEEK